MDINQKDPNRLLNNFYNSITYLLDEFANKKKVTRKEYKLKFKPCVTNEILQQCKERDFLLKCCTKDNDPIKKDNQHATYKSIRNAITRSKRDSKALYFSQFFEKNRTKSSEIWKGIRSLVNIKSSRNNNINLLGKNNELINDHLLTAKFNDYFSTIGSVINNKITSTNGSYKHYFKKRTKMVIH